jgi:hypothetical protein
MTRDRLRQALPGRRAAHIFISLILLATAADWLGPIVPAGVGAPLLRLASGHEPSAAGGAIEAGFVCSAFWLVFEA